MRSLVWVYTVQASVPVKRAAIFKLYWIHSVNRKKTGQQLLISRWPSLFYLQMGYCSCTSHHIYEFEYASMYVCKHQPYRYAVISLKTQNGPRKLQCWDSIKPSLRFSWFCVFFVSKGNPFYFFFAVRAKRRTLVKLLTLSLHYDSIMELTKKHPWWLFLHKVFLHKTKDS